MSKKREPNAVTKTSKPQLPLSTQNGLNGVVQMGNKSEKLHNEEYAEDMTESFENASDENANRGKKSNKRNDRNQSQSDQETVHSDLEQ